ncbi:MAG: oligosaccharide flippase family protein [Chitinivibrionales bacterium]|nr:oligosaccharide flippase family protein [Chitinivibrionales bacterium]
MSHNKPPEARARASVHRPSLTVNALSNWTSIAVHMAVGFLLTPVIIQSVGKTGYGIWTIVHSFVGYYGLLNLGVRSAIMRYVARDAARGDVKALNETVDTAAVVFLITGTVAALLSFILARPLTAFFDISDEYRRIFIVVVWVLGISTAVEFLSSVLAAILSAYEKYVAINIVNVLSYLGRAVLIVIALRSGGGVAELAYATLAMAAAILISKFIICRRGIPDIGLSLRRARWSTLKMLLGYGLATIVMNVVNMMRTRLDSVVIGRWVDIEAVAVYGVAAQIIQYFYSLVNTGVGVVTPRFARLDGTQRHQEMRRLFRRSLYVGGLLAFGGGMMAAVFGRAFIALWVGDGFQAAVPVLWVLLASYTLGLAQSSGYGLMLARDRHRVFARIMVIEAMANVALSIVLAPRLGILGVALGTAIPMLVVKLLVQPIYVCRVARVSLREYVAPLAVPAFVAAVMTGALMGSGVLPLLDRLSIPAFLGAGAVIGALYVVVVYLTTRTRSFAPDFGKTIRSLRPAAPGTAGDP